MTTPTFSPSSASTKSPQSRRKTAVILCQLGGPDRLESVRPFLFNLFSDRAIISLPNPWRWLLAHYISRARTQKACGIYSLLGGGSPILAQTQAQAAALETYLNGDSATNNSAAATASSNLSTSVTTTNSAAAANSTSFIASPPLMVVESPATTATDHYQVFVAMRYWLPRAAETIAKVEQYNPDRLVILPLYPQFSTTTTASSFAELRHLIDRSDALSAVPVTEIGCHFWHHLFIEAQVTNIIAALQEVAEKYPGQTVRLLFSAHSLPQRVIEAGDPYQEQIEETVAAVMAKLRLSLAGEPSSISNGEKLMGVPEESKIAANGRKTASLSHRHLKIEHNLCYQSRVGTVIKWLQPTLDDAIKQAKNDQRGIIIIPIAFVSEHSETLVEIDIEYRKMAEEAGLPFYLRTQTLQTSPDYIRCLDDLVRNYPDVTPLKPCKMGKKCGCRR